MSASYTEWLKVMSLLVRAWQNVVHWRREWQTSSAFLPWEPHEQHEKKQKDRTLKDESPRLVGVQYTTKEQWRNSSRRNEETEPKQKQCPVVDVSGGENKVWCCKEQYCIGICNVKSRNQGKLELVKQEMARMNVNILGISELKWIRMFQCHSSKYHVWNELPVQVRCTILDAWGWCTGTTQKDGMGREEGGRRRV